MTERKQCDIVCLEMTDGSDQLAGRRNSEAYLLCKLFFLTTISGDRNRLELNKYQTREDKK